MLKLVSFAILWMCFVGAALAQELPPAAQWATTAFSEYRVSPNITYKKANGHDIKLDVITAGAPSQLRPTLIYIHGGGWVGGSKEDHALFVTPYLTRGMNAVNVEYRLASDSLAPAAVEDCRCALSWVYRHAKEYGFDTSKLVVAGESAGGHLSLMTGILDQAAGFDNECPPDPASGSVMKVQAIVDYCGIADVADVLEGPHVQTFALMWFASLPNRSELARRVSPFTYVRQGLPPIIIIHGDQDTTVPYQESVQLHEALDRAGVPNEFITIPGGKHWGWPRDQYLRAQQAVFAFLEQHQVLSR
jgi:acetyl esterase/lipase